MALFDNLFGTQQLPHSPVAPMSPVANAARPGLGARFANWAQSHPQMLTTLGYNLLANSGRAQAGTNAAQRFGTAAISTQRQLQQAAQRKSEQRFRDLQSQQLAQELKARKQKRQQQKMLADEIQALIDDKSLSDANRNRQVGGLLARFGAGYGDAKAITGGLGLMMPAERWAIGETEGGIPYAYEALGRSRPSFGPNASGDVLAQMLKNAQEGGEKKQPTETKTEQGPGFWSSLGSWISRNNPPSAEGGLGARTRMAQILPPDVAPLYDNATALQQYLLRNPELPMVQRNLIRQRIATLNMFPKRGAAPAPSGLGASGGLLGY